MRAKLRTLALQASSANGVATPQTMLAVASPDHQAAEKVVSGSIVYDHTPVYVIEMTGGTFTANFASPPAGQPVPQGNVLTLTVDTTAYRLMDIGVGPVAPDLTQISPDVVDLTKQ